MPSAKNKVQPQNISHEHELDSKGVYQLANGAWAYRFCKSVNGKNVYKRASTDRKGNPLLTQRDAMLAREEAMLEAQGVYTPVISTLGIVYRPSATIEEVYEDYCANGRGDRSHNTIKRQDTLWRTYLKADFGKKRFNGISLGEIQDYLANKYYVEGYSYRYVESFLKMFYAQHPISMSEIKKKLAKRLSNHEPDRKAIYDDFDALEAYGFIVHREPNGKRYYLENPDFTYNEVRMIADCVSASKFLSERQARNLIEKLKGLCTVYDSSKLTRQVVVQNRTRTDNDESRDELDKIFQAINERKQISYLYFDYDLRKRRKYRYKDDIKCISPWAVIYDNNFYYLLAYDGKKMRVYRIDHMEGVEVEEAEAEGLEEFKKIKLSDYTKQTFGMYSGELQSVTMRFPNNMVGTVLDRFGREVTLMKADDRHFRITVPIAVSPQFYGWVFGLKNMVTIESPQSVVDGMKEMLAAVEKRYEDSKGSQ